MVRFFKNGFCILLFFSLLRISHAQNLILNPGFEEGDTITESDLITKMRLSYFCIGKETFFRPSHWNGLEICIKLKQPYTNMKTAGIKVGHINRTYLIGTLVHPLQKDAKYRMRYKASFTISGDIHEEKLGVIFLNKKPPVETPSKILTQYTPIILSDTLGRYIRQQAESLKLFSWSDISSEFIAEGGERFFLVGNFENDKCEVCEKNMWVFVDNFSLEKIEKSNYMERLEKLKLQSGNSDTLSVVLFDFDQSVLRSDAPSVLDPICGILNNDLRISLTICAHADSLGSETYNMQLSEKRGEAVIVYLMQKGIARERLKIIPYGESAPASSNSSEEGRQLNRRVNFVFRKH